jgi:hypothetical protein
MSKQRNARRRPEAIVDFGSNIGMSAHVGTSRHPGIAAYAWQISFSLPNLKRLPQTFLKMHDGRRRPSWILVLYFWPLDLSRPQAVDSPPRVQQVWRIACLPRVTWVSGWIDWPWPILLDTRLMWFFFVSQSHFVDRAPFMERRNSLLIATCLLVGGAF